MIKNVLQSTSIVKRSTPANCMYCICVLQNSLGKWQFRLSFFSIFFLAPKQEFLYIF